MKQHTGNWPGKTVVNAQGHCVRDGQGYVMVDIPGCYSLMAHSAEEEVARDFVCFGMPDAVIVVCDATCLERNLNLVLQVMEATPRVVVGVNLMDEAKKKKITVDLNELSRRLGVPVIGTAARSNRGLTELMDALEGTFAAPPARNEPAVRYPDYIERALKILTPAVETACGGKVCARWLAARLLDGSESLLYSVRTYLGFDPAAEPGIADALETAGRLIENGGVSPQRLRDDLAAAFVGTAAEICRGAVRCEKKDAHHRDRMLDKLFTSRATGFPIMLLLLFGIFWLTITGANYPSALLADGLFWLEDWMAAGLLSLGAPVLFIDLVIHGAYRVMAWVISVMLPPMAIFFPLFTLLEDFGYLPRVAFNLDRCFKGCKACGKQALTMIIDNINLQKKSQ